MIALPIVAVQTPMRVAAEQTPLGRLPDLRMFSRR
jgi:hypothetical protein